MSASTFNEDDENCELRCLAAQVVSQPDTWLDTPNDQLGGRKPSDLIGTPTEVRVRELLRSIKHGMPT